MYNGAVSLSSKDIDGTPRTLREGEQNHLNGTETADIF